MNAIKKISRLFESNIGCLAPPEYINLLESLKESTVIKHPKTPRRTWLYLSAEDIDSPINIDGNKGSQYHAVSLFGKALISAGINNLNGSKKQSMAFLEHTFSFAHDNGDYLFLRPDLSVWIFYHDGHKIKEVSYNYEEFHGSIVLPKSLKLVGVPLNTWETKLLGRWKASSTESDLDFFNLIKHDLILNEDRTAQKLYELRGELSNGTWYANAKRFVYITNGQELGTVYKLDQDTLDMGKPEGSGDHIQYKQKTANKAQ